MKNGNVIRIDGSPLRVIRRELETTLPRKEYEFLQEVLEAYLYMRAGGRNNTQKTVQSAILSIEDFIVFNGKAPWNSTENDYNKWCHHLGRERKVAPSSERKYQGIIEDFYEFLTREPVIVEKLQRKFDVTPQQIVFERIIHNNPNEGQRARNAMTDAELDAMMAAINKRIAEAYTFAGKDLYPFMRDKCMYYLTYALGLRANEVLGLNMDSFFPDATVPEFGNFGFAIVFGKGSRGSGPKRREVPIENPMVPKLMKWYMEKVRPKHLFKAKIGETALFLSDWGRRLSIQSFDARFKQIMELAGFPADKFVPHCLRHTSVSNKSMDGYSLKANQDMHGHAFASSTEHYSHIPDEFIRKEIRKHTQRNIEAYKRIKGERDERKTEC